MLEPTSRQVSWVGMIDAISKDRYRSEDGYVFSNGRVFKNQDNSNGGVYDDEYPYTFTFSMS